jgi:hypothetical protein
MKEEPAEKWRVLATAVVRRALAPTAPHRGQFNYSVARVGNYHLF